MDVVHVVLVLGVDAVYGAHLNASRVLDPDARLGDDVRHSSRKTLGFLSSIAPGAQPHKCTLRYPVWQVRRSAAGWSWCTPSTAKERPRRLSVWPSEPWVTA